MPHEVRIPRLGWSMDEGIFVGWLKRPGDSVAIGEPLFELEGEKALQEVESIDAGILYLPDNAAQPGSTLPVGALLGYLLLPGEDPPGPNETPASSPDQTSEKHRSQTQTLNAPSPEIRQLSPGSTHEQAPPRVTPVATPRAKRIARERGVDWTTLKGSGKGGRIRETDVLANAKSSHGPSLSSRRKAIGQRLKSSFQQSVPVTLMAQADAGNLISLRKQFKALGVDVVPSFGDMIACLVARLLRSQPAMSRRWSDDRQSLLQIPEEQIHIGFAVDTPDGLLVPVIREVARKSLLSVARESALLIERARAGRLSMEEMSQGVLTITNLGSFGIEGFTPIINSPEIAILGLGAIQREAIVLADDRIVPGDRMTLSLTFDHAAIDGAPAAAFLKRVVEAIENPSANLLLE